MILKIDFGSGHNPLNGYKKCDVTQSPNLDFVFDPQSYRIIGCQDGSVDEIFCRNVLHHVQDLERLFEEFRRVLKIGGRLVVVEPTKESFGANLLKDYLWYRVIIPRYEVWYSDKYREYEDKIIKKVGPMISKKKNREYETSVFEKKGKTYVPAYRDASDSNLVNGCCYFCGQAWHNCLCCHDED